MTGPSLLAAPTTGQVWPRPAAGTPPLTGQAWPRSGGVEGGGGFDAEAYGPTLAWWSADSITALDTVPAHGAAVNSWVSAMSSGTNVLTKNGGTATYNSDGWVDFTSAYFTSESVARSADYTCYILLHPTTNAQMGYFSADGGVRWWQLRVHTDDALRIEPFNSFGQHQGSMTTPPGTALKNQWAVYTMVRGGPFGTMLRQNGVQVLNNPGAAPGGGGSVRPLLVGHDYDTGNDPYTGRVKETVMYPVAHDEETMATIEAALLATVS